MELLRNLRDTLWGPAMLCLMLAGCGGQTKPAEDTTPPAEDTTPEGSVSDQEAADAVAALAQDRAEDLETVLEADAQARRFVHEAVGKA